MDGLIIVFIYFLIVLSMPFALLVTAYYAYFHDGKVLEVVLRLIASLTGFVGITAATVPIFGIIVLAGAHGEHGIRFDFKGWIIFSSITLLYAGVCYLLICLVKGGLINPWKLFGGLGNKHISIFESKER